MNQTVDFETAKELREAGFPQAAHTSGSFWWLDNLCVVRAIYSDEIHFSYVGSYGNDISLAAYQLPEYSTYAPTSNEIIAQMPIGTTIGTLVDPKNTDTIWECVFPLPMMQHDSRFDKCPHKCAAKAFIAWKRGMTE